MSKQTEKNIPLAIAFMVAFLSGSASFCIVLGQSDKLPLFVTVPVLLFCVSSATFWWFEHGDGQ